MLIKSEINRCLIVSIVILCFLFMLRFILSNKCKQIGSSDSSSDSGKELQTWHLRREPDGKYKLYDGDGNLYLAEEDQTTECEIASKKLLLNDKMEYASFGSSCSKDIGQLKCTVSGRRVIFSPTSGDADELCEYPVDTTSHSGRAIYPATYSKGNPNAADKSGTFPSCVVDQGCSSGGYKACKLPDKVTKYSQENFHSSNKTNCRFGKDAVKLDDRYCEDGSSDGKHCNAKNFTDVCFQEGMEGVDQKWQDIYDTFDNRDVKCSYKIDDEKINSLNYSSKGKCLLGDSNTEACKNGGGVVAGEVKVSYTKGSGPSINSSECKCITTGQNTIANRQSILPFNDKGYYDITTAYKAVIEDGKYFKLLTPKLDKSGRPIDIGDENKLTPQIMKEKMMFLDVNPNNYTLHAKTGGQDVGDWGTFDNSNSRGNGFDIKMSHKLGANWRLSWEDSPQKIAKFMNSTYNFFTNPFPVKDSSWIQKEGNHVTLRVDPSNAFASVMYGGDLYFDWDNKEKPSRFYIIPV